MGIRRPSRATINEARRLGMRMAALDHDIRPAVDGSSQYVSYAQFVHTHRHYIEVSKAFAKWEHLLEGLAEYEEKSQHTWVNEPADWDGFLREVVEPIRSAFWSSWETAVELKKLFEQRAAPTRTTSHAAPQLAISPSENEHGGSGLMELGSALSDLEVRASDLV